MPVGCDGFCITFTALLGQTPRCWPGQGFLHISLEKFIKLQNASKHACIIKYSISLPRWLPVSFLKSYLISRNRNICIPYVSEFPAAPNMSFLCSSPGSEDILETETQHCSCPFSDLLSTLFPVNNQNNRCSFSGKMSLLSFAGGTTDKNALATAERNECTIKCCGYPHFPPFHFTSFYFCHQLLLIGRYPLLEQPFSSSVGMLSQKP